MKKTPTPKKSIFSKVKTQIPSPDPKTNKINDQYEVGESLRQSEYRYRELFENSLMAISIVDLEGFLIQANAAYARMYGYENAQEMITSGINVGQFYANRDKRNEVIDILKKYEKMEPCEIEVVRRDGTHFFVLVSASVIKDETGKIIHYQANHIDITERKNLEKDLNENETLFTTLFHSSPIPISLSEIDTENWIEVNEAFLKVTGYSRHEVIGRSFRDINLLKNIADREKMRSLLKSQGYIKSFEVEINKKDGSSGTMLISVEIVDISDKPYLLISGDEITERKNVEDELYHSEKRYRTFIDATPDGVFLKDENSRYIVTNRSLEKIFNKPKEEILGKTDSQLMNLTFALNCANSDKQASANNDVVVSEEKWDEEIFETVKFPFEYQKGKIGIGGYIRDITERRQVEEALKENSEKFNLFLQYSPIYTYIKEVTPTESRVVVASNNFSDMIGRKATEMIGKTMEELFPTEFAAKMTADDWNVISNKKTLTLEENFNDRNYTTIKFPIKMGGKNLVAGYTIDITEQKQAEKLLQWSEESYRLLFNACPDGISYIGKNGKFEMVNTAEVKMYGYNSPDEMVGLDSSMMVAESDREYARQIRQKRFKGEVIPSIEYELVRKDGTLFYGEILATTLHNDEGAVSGYICVTRDITQRKQTEKSLQEVQNLFQSLYENTLNGIAYCKIHRNNKGTPIDFSYIAVNDSFEKQTGLKDVVGKKISEIVPGILETDKELIEIYGRVAETGIPEHFENYVDGLKMWFYISVYSPEKDFFVAVFDVITERKQSEATLNDIIDKNPMSIQIIDTKGCTLKTNPANTLLFGTPPPPDFSIFDDLLTRYPQLKKYIVQAKRGQVVHLPDILYNTHDIFPELPDNPKWIKATVFPLKDSAGNPERFVFMHEDITERKLAEEALKDSESKYQFIVENTDDLLWTMNSDLKFEYISPSVTKLMGYTVEEHMKHTLDDYLTPESAQMIKEEFMNGMINLQNNEYHKLRDRADFELEFIRKDKTQGYGFTSMIMMRDEQYQLKKIRGRTFDITERKLIEKYNALGKNVLQTLNEPNDWAQSIQKVITVLKEGTGFDAVGIRLQVEDDYLYYANQGFSKDFLKTENTLQGRTSEGLICKDKEGNIKLECTCGLVISGKTNPSLPFFTVGGSFWINDSSLILNIPPDNDPRFQPRNICIHEGYKSFALIPIRNSERIVGLIQLNDKCKDRFTLNTIQLFEGIASHIGTALMRKQAEEALQNKMEELMRFHHLTVGRELTMIELKKEVNTLLKQSGQEEKYKIVG